MSPRDVPRDVAPATGFGAEWHRHISELHSGPRYHRTTFAASQGDGQIDFLVIVIALGWIIGFGLSAAQSAARLDRVPSIWFAFGAVLGPVALLLLSNMPPGHCRTCGTPTQGWLRTCRWCGEDVTVVPASTLAILARMAGPTERPPEDKAELESEPEPPLAEPRPLQLESPQTRTAAPPRPAAGLNLAASARTAAAPTAAASPAATPTHAASPFAISPPPASHVTSRPSEWPERAGRPLESPAAVTPVPPAITWPSGPSGVNALFGSPSSHAVTGSRAPQTGEPDVATRVLATAVYVTGNVRLEPGRRYAIGLSGSRLQILGPYDIDPAVVVLDRPVEDVDVNSVEGRFVLSEPRRKSGLVLAFMSVAGTTPTELATIIRSASNGSSPS